MNQILSFAIRVFIAIVNVVPTNWLRGLIYKVLSLVKYREQVINNNFNNTTVASYYNAGEATFYKETLRHIARIFAETMQSIRPNQVEAISFAGIKALESSCKQSGGLLLLASHYANWELSCSLLPIHTTLPVYGVYKPLKNEVIDQILKEKRQAHGLHLIPMKKIGRTILENKKNGIAAIYILIGDQNPNSKNSIIWSNFMGVKSAFFNGPQKLVDKYGFSCSYMATTAASRLFQYSVDIQPLTVDVEGQIIGGYAKRLEQQIAEEPTHWLWSHKRWKRSF